MTTYTGTHVLGYLDENGTKNGPRNCTATLAWRLTEAGQFTATGVLKYPGKRYDIAGGQIVGELCAQFPEDAKAQRILKVWERWHLNHLHAGTPEQMAVVRALPKRERGYDNASARLREVGLYEVTLPDGRLYRYGSAWLKEELPDDIKALIVAGFEETTP